MNEPTALPQPSIVKAPPKHVNLMTLPPSVGEPDFSPDSENRTYVIGLTSGDPATKEQEVYSLMKWIRENSDAWTVHNNNTPRGAIYDLGDNPLPGMDAETRRKMYCYVLASSAALPLLFPGDERDSVFSSNDGRRVPGIIMIEENIDTRESAAGSQQSRQMLGVCIDLMRGQRRMRSGEQAQATSNDAIAAASALEQLRIENATLLQSLNEQAIRIEALEAELQHARAALAQPAANPPITESVPVVDEPPAAVQAPNETPAPAPAAAVDAPAPSPSSTAPTKSELLERVRTAKHK